MSEWKEIEINEIIDIANTGLDAIKRAPIVKHDTGIKCMRIQDVSQNKSFVDWGFTRVEAKNYDKFQLKKNDIIIARTGATVGVNKFIYSDLESVFNNGLIRIRTKHEECLPKFLYYHFRTDNFKSFIESISGGTSSQPNMQINVLLSYNIPIPPLPEQKAIAEVLSGLDDKIDLLHRQNKTLEQMAETLFRQWFVEEAKEDWKEVSIYEAINLIGGGTPQTSINEYWEGDIKWLSGKDIAANHKSVITTSEKLITKEGLNNSSAKLLPKFSTVISARGTVGKYCILSESMAFSQSNYGIKPKFDGCYFYTYLLINHSVEELQSAAYGSVFDTITTDTFKGYIIKTPSEIEIQAFENNISSYFYKILNNKTQIRTLEKMRDTLLPKLMSGEVRVQSRRDETFVANETTTNPSSIGAKQK